MGFVIAALNFFGALLFGVFMLSNIVFPIFFSLPRLKSLKRQERLVKPIPYLRVVIAPVLWMVVLMIAITIYRKWFPRMERVFYAGLIVAALFVLKRFALRGRKDDLVQDFERSYREFLK